MQFLSGEHKFPFFELECFSHRIACIKMAGQSHFSVAPEKGFSTAFWFNLRSGSHLTPELMLCSISKSSSSMNLLDLRYHCTNGSMIIKLGNQEPNDYLICPNVKLQPHRWYHICVIFQLFSTSTMANVKYKNKPTFDILLYINGIKYKHFNQPILLIKKDEPTGNEKSEAIMPHKIMYGSLLQPCDCKLTIGVDSKHLVKQHRPTTTIAAGSEAMVWWIGSIFVFNGVLSQKQVGFIFGAGTDYEGTFHAARGVSYIQEKQEKISHCPSRIDTLPPIACSFHPHCHYTFAEARRVLLSNRTDLEPEELSPFLLEANAIEKSPLEEIVNIAGLRSPGGIIKNTAHELNARITYQGPYAYLNGGVTCIRPIALEDAIRYVGGVENLFGFLTRAHSSKAMIDHCAILATFLANNPRNLMDMARIGGYEMLGNILREKHELITEELVPVLMSMVTNTIPKTIREHFARSRNLTREVRISESTIALYNHVGCPVSSYKKRIHAVAPTATASLELLAGMDHPVRAIHYSRAMDGHSMEITTSPSSHRNSVRHSTVTTITVDSMLSDPSITSADHNISIGTNGDDASMGLDYREFHQKGLSLLELPIVIERRYVQEFSGMTMNGRDYGGGYDDDEFEEKQHFERNIKERFQNNRYATEEILLANTLLMKHVILDFEIWSQVATNIQSALYGWLTELCMTGPSMASMEGMQNALQLSRISGLSATTQPQLQSQSQSQLQQSLKMASSQSLRKWNAMRLRDIESMDDILYILSHEQANTKTKMAMFQFAERLIMENFREEELQLIAAFLVHHAVESEYEYSQSLSMAKAKPVKKDKFQDDWAALRKQRFDAKTKSQISFNVEKKDLLNVKKTHNSGHDTVEKKKHSRNVWMWHQIEGSMKHADIVVEFMKILFVYIHNNAIHAKSFNVSKEGHINTNNNNNNKTQSNKLNASMSNDILLKRSKDMSVSNSNVKHSFDSYYHNTPHSPERSGTVSFSSLVGNVLIDTDFLNNFAKMCEKLNIFWFAKLLSPILGGQVNRAALCVLNKIMTNSNDYMTAFHVCYP
ncbi:hypothetical protein RFI_12805 [Reticulomyxa filosa]|uniref:Uncharacterized protein n=1 Tax=Reticulomyxa filosa TaxID=46433 RepID=X6NEN1_RETFI|nr:hypothetical protein RFI_12805 [Reticulomyxa filosa]|eukprot:ETO24353.1 hypothetical protein RFI_12805 [Reticulomyxa filosa]